MPFSSSSSTDFHEKSFRIRHEDSKLFNKLLSKESSKSYPSFRVYYGDVSGAVPFVWETCPGTPKHTFADKSNAPPLTPPPSYYANTFKKYSKSTQSRSKLLLYALLRRMNPKKYRSSSSPNSTLSSVSSLSWSPSSRSSFSDAATTPRANTFTQYRRKRFSSWDSSFYDTAAEHHEKGVIGTSSKPCFSPGGYPVLIVKKALLSIVGRGSHA